MNWNTLTLSGWGRNHHARQRVCRPERMGDLPRAFADAPSLLARGAGRSYGDSATNAGGGLILMERLNRFLAFDPETGVVECEAGVTFGDILTTFLPRGFLFPVTPGTCFTTLGGGLAHDVHGKNHDQAGSLGHHVLWFDLLLPSGEERRVSPTSDPALFAATLGGAGLTGVILRLALQLVPVASNHMQVREERMGSIHDFIEALESARRSATFSVGWIDALAQGASLGRGILETAEFSSLLEPIPLPQGGHTIPFDLPDRLLNPVSIRLFNALYYRRIPREGRQRPLPLPDFFYPLDALLHWNRIYGQRGFHQFQCVIPNAEARRALPALLKEISQSRAASFLAVIKTMGHASLGMLGFPMPGFTLALDFPNRPGLSALYARLEGRVLDHGGRLYLAKESLASPASLPAMYPRLDEFRQVLHRIDPTGRMQSDLSRRLNLRGDQP